MIWLEEVDRDGHVRRRTGHEALPLRIGRAFDAELPLDDPFADPYHAELARDMEGRLVLTDLGSLNGLRRPGGERQRVLTMLPGQPVQLGRTLLRLADPAVGLAPARPDVAESGWREALRHPTMPLAALLALAALSAALAVLVDPGAGGPMLPLTAATVLPVTALLLAAAWAVAHRLLRGAAHFREHAGVAAIGVAAFALVSLIPSWIDTALGGGAATQWLDRACGTVIAATWLFGHLTVLSRAPGAHLWRPAFLVAAGLQLVVAGLGMQAGEAGARAAHFEASLRPLPAGLLRAESPARFADGLEALRETLDRD
ncbi:MAG: FHA domain-containing protein [Gemmatimonadales bacterium]|nr:FHA domain-containing protein [Gemmatimonadales bacterium]